jgi:hypothetical protein
MHRVCPRLRILRSLNNTTIRANEIFGVRGLLAVARTAGPPSATGRNGGAAYRALHSGRPSGLAAAASVLKTPEIASQDEVPIVGMDERRVSIGWDAQTWSRLCVATPSLGVILGSSQLP